MTAEGVFVCAGQDSFLKVVSWEILQNRVAFSRKIRYNTVRITRERRQKMIPQDPAMLLSFVNMKLRDFYGSIEELCEDLQEDQGRLEEILSGIDYHYDREKNQFV